MFEILIKTLGVIIILYAGTGMGISESRRIQERVMLLENMIRMLSLLKEEIRFGNISLKEAFQRTGRKMQGTIGEFLTLLTEKMQDPGKQPLPGLFNLSAEKILKNTPLSKEEKEMFGDIGGYLGYLDTAMQIRELQHLQTKFEEYLKELKKELTVKRELCKRLGVFGAVFLILLLW